MTATIGPVFPAETDAILFLDESGTSNYLSPAQLALHHAAVAAGNSPPLPFLFALAGVLFRRTDYSGFHAEFRALKARHFGSETVVLHERDIRRVTKPEFKVLRDPARWTAFYDDLSRLTAAVPFKVIVVVVHKPEMQAKYPIPFPPYGYGLECILERVVFERPWFGQTCRVVAESREAGLNDELRTAMLELQFAGGGSGIVNSANTVSAAEVRQTFDPQIVFRCKADNDSGLQLADLAAGPIARHTHGLDDGLTRTVRGIMTTRLRKHNGRVAGCGVICFPQGIPPDLPF